MRLFMSVNFGIFITSQLMFLLPTFLGVQLARTHPVLVLLVALGVFVCYGVGFWSVALRPDLVRRFISADLKDQESDGTISALWPPALFAAGFVVLCRSLAVLRPEIVVESSRGLVSEIEWVLFGIDQIARVLLLDFFEIFHIHISAVHPMNWFWLNLITFVFRASMSLFLVKLVISVYRSWPNHSHH